MLNKKVLILILLVVVMVAAVVFYFVFFRTAEEGDNSYPNNNQPVVDNQGQLPSGSNIEGGDNGEEASGGENVIQANQGETDAVNLARFFVEMIGSYSPEARFQNVVDLQPMMTSSMLSWSENLIKRNNAAQPLDESITTRVVKTEILSFSETEARVRVLTRRTKTSREQETNYSQEAEVDLIKETNTWKVDNLIWK